MVPAFVAGLPTHSQRLFVTRFCKSRWMAWLVVIAISSVANNPLLAQDKTWDNGSADLAWNTSSLNWGGTAWNNTIGGGAIFNPTGVGTINVPGQINVDSMNFTANGYILNGTGPINFQAGTSTQTTGVVRVGDDDFIDPGITARINAPITSSIGFQKVGDGVLELGGTGNSFTGQIAVVGNGKLYAGVLIGGAFGNAIPGGTLRLLNANALAPTTNVSIGPGYLDIGNNNVTLANLIFTNQTQTNPWNNTLNANNGVIGSGTLRVTGDIHVIGVTGNNFGTNTIATNLNMGGGDQVVRVGVQSQFILNRALLFTGSLSNGSLTKSYGLQSNGVFAAVDGISLLGNNTYTGASRFNAGTNIATGTNASQSIVTAGVGSAGGSLFALQGANGSFQSATTIQAVSGSSFVLDNNAALSGNDVPAIAAAQNNDRIRDDAVITLRDGGLVFRGLANTVASEAFGNMNLTGGHNSIIVSPNVTIGNTETSTITGNNLTIAPRSTLMIGTSGTATQSFVLGTQAKVKFNGTIPAADNTGIIRGVVTGSVTSNFGVIAVNNPSDLVIYDATDGFKAFTGYATDFTTAGSNVNVSAASTVAASQNINALKATTASAFTTTIGAGNTLTVNSGMMLSTSGVHTITGGILAFGSSPGMFFGNHTVSSAITGTNGLIQSLGNLTLNGDLSGLSGPLTVNGSGTTTLVGNSFAGEIEIRRGAVLLQQAQTGASLGAVRLGVAGSEADLIGTFPTLQFNSTGVNLVTQIDRDIIVDNGGLTVAGAEARYNMTASLSPLSNATGSQTLTGDITLNSHLRLQGGGGSTLTNNSTIFQGNISGQGTFFSANGRVIFDTSSVLSNTGGLQMGDYGFTSQVTMRGTATGNAETLLRGGNNTFLAYAGQNSLYTGKITVDGLAAIVPMNTSTINNQIDVTNTSTMRVNVASGNVATWNGPLTGNGALSMQTVLSGVNTVFGTNNGMGTLVLASNANTHTGAINVNTGTLMVNGLVAASANAVTVAAAGTLGGIGVINRNITVNGKLAPGNSPGVLTVNGNVTFSATGTFAVEANSASPGTGYDQLFVNGAVSLGSANLGLTTGFSPVASDRLFILVNDGADSIVGLFNGLGEGSSFVWSFGGNNQLGTITYLADFGSNSLTGGNDVALYGFAAIPEPGTLGVMSLLVLAAVGSRRRIR